jgi:hypothetical protein
MFSKCTVVFDVLVVCFVDGKVGEKEGELVDICSHSWESSWPACCPECLHLVTPKGLNAV